MARVNLERRAEIGLAKRNRTRAAILEAARACYSAAKAAPVTVDAVMQAAGLAKGTFYVHFEDLGALEAALGEALTEEHDRRLQPGNFSFLTGGSTDSETGTVWPYAMAVPPWSFLDASLAGTGAAGGPGSS